MTLRKARLSVSSRGRTAFKNAKEFGGSLFRQLEDTYSYLQFCNRTMATRRS